MSHTSGGLSEALTEIPDAFPVPEDGGPSTPRRGTPKRLSDRPMKSILERSQTLAERFTKPFRVNRRRAISNSMDRSEATTKMLEVAGNLDKSLLDSSMAGFQLLSETRYLLKWTAAKHVRVSFVQTDTDTEPASTHSNDTQSTHTITPTSSFTLEKSLPSRRNSHYVDSGCGDRKSPDGRSELALPMLHQYAADYNSEFVKYKDVHVFLFNDLVLIVKHVARRYVALSVPLYLKSLVVYECEPPMYQASHKFRLVFGDYQYVLKVGGPEERNEWVTQTIGATEWLDTVDSYTWTLSAPDSRNAQTRSASVPFRSTALPSDQEVHDLLGVPLEADSKGQCEGSGDDVGSSSQATATVSTEVIPVSPRGDTEEGEGDNEIEDTFSLDTPSGLHPRPHSASDPLRSSVFVVAPPDKKTSISRSRSNSNNNRGMADGGEDGQVNAMYLNVGGEDVMIFQETMIDTKRQLYVLAGTVEKLVEHLADEYPFDEEYVKIFLTTYRAIMEPVTLLDMLIGRFNSLPRSSSKEDMAFYAQWKKPIQQRVLRVVMIWIQDHWCDFSSDPELFDRLMRFVPEMKASGWVISCGLTQDAIQKEQEKHEELQRKAPYFLRPPDEPVEESLFFSYSDKEIAEQITLFDSLLYRRITTRQFLNHIWPPKGQSRAEHSPDLHAFIERFNHGSYWVATRICMLGDDSKAQCRVLTKFVNVARICLSLQNYYGAFSIMGGLRFPPVRALKAVWDIVPPKTMGTIRDFERTFMNPSRNMKIYRDAVDRPGTVPTVPFLPLSLKDLVFINDGNDLHVADSRMYNFDKMRMIARVCHTLNGYKKPPYTINERKDIQSYVRGAYVCFDLDYLRSLNTKHPITRTLSGSSGTPQQSERRSSQAQRSPSITKRMF